MKRRVHIDPNGRAYHLARGRRFGSVRVYHTLTARCTICEVPDTTVFQGITTHHDLKRCLRCYNMACKAHYDNSRQLCTDCLAYTRKEELL